MRTIVTREKWVDGVCVETEELSNEVTQEPIAEVVRVGTKPRVAGQAVVGSNSTLIDQNGNPVSYSKVITGKCSAYTGGGCCSTGVPAAFGRVAVNLTSFPMAQNSNLFPGRAHRLRLCRSCCTGGACMKARLYATCITIP